VQSVSSVAGTVFVLQQSQTGTVLIKAKATLQICFLT